MNWYNLMKRFLLVLALVGFQALASGLGTPTRADATTDSQLLQAFQAGLKNKDKAALMALYHWEGVPDWIKQNQSDEIDDLLTRDYRNADLGPLPTNFPTIFSNEVLHAHLNFPPTGRIQFGFTDSFGTAVTYGKIGDAYFLTSTIIEQNPLPPTATNDLVIQVQSAEGQPAAAYLCQRRRPRPDSMAPFLENVRRRFSYRRPGANAGTGRRNR